MKLKDQKTILLVVWLFLIILILFGCLFFTKIKDIFLEIVVISFLFIIFYFIDDLIFEQVGRHNVKINFISNLFQNNFFAFPFFLLEIFILWWLSGLLEQQLPKLISTSYWQWWFIPLWGILMYCFYWLKTGGIDKIKKFFGYF